MFLPIPGTDIIGTGVAENIGKSLFGRYIFAGAPNDHCQLALVVHLITTEVAGENDRVSRILESIDAFDEEDGVLRERGLHLLSVAAVVQANAENLNRDDGGKKFGCIRLFAGRLEPGERISITFDGGTVGLQGSVMDGLFGIEITDYFHAKRVLPKPIWLQPLNRAFSSRKERL
jgi:hypothetical protein